VTVLGPAVELVRVVLADLPDAARGEPGAAPDASPKMDKATSTPGRQ